MTQDEIIRMAREAGCRVEHIGNAFLNNDGNLYALSELELKRFAALVAEATKEQLFKELMDMHRTANGQHNYYQYAVIQLRGEPV